ncbi:MAG: hypothetical protein ACLQVD_20890 [Capsulimonadaceae bacterium]
MTQYQYDADSRLLAESGLVATNTYTYDPVGNRLTRTGTTGTVSYSYDANDRLVSKTVNGFTTNIGFDANGNQLGVGGEAATYDFANRLSTIGSGPTGSTFAYDGAGNRVQSVVAGTTTNYVVDVNTDNAEVVEERDGANNLLARYDHGNGLIRMDHGGNPFYFVNDGSGSVRALTNASGQPTGDDYTYDAFGVQAFATGTTVNPFRYDGEQSDSTGLYYLRARYYSPLRRSRTGRLSCII